MAGQTPVSVTAEPAVGPWLAARSQRVIETSCARVYLAADTAWKIKRAVNLGFLDFSTLEKRHWALQRELAFNQRAAPDIYRALVPISRAAAGGFEIGGDGEIVEWALEMRRFSEADVLAHHPASVDGPLAERLGRAIATAHIAARVTPNGAGVAALGYTLATNAEHLRPLAPRLGGAAEVESVLSTIDAAFARQAPLLEARRREGFARHCHGDLHLANILVEAGQPKFFDCIEFNDALSEIDVLYDLAFLLMDLDLRGCRPAANRVLNAWLDEAARGLPASLWAGLAALPLMCAARACVRAHVTAGAGDRRSSKAYLAAARAHLAARPPRLAAVGGLSGSGKTSFARRLAPMLGDAPGAIILRSDEIRKRQWGAGPLDRLSPQAYDPDADARVYEEMFALAATLLGAGRSVVLDAVFQQPARREAAGEVARGAGAPFDGVWLQGAPDLLAGRLARRSSDASDADRSVLEGQLARDSGDIAWPCAPADGDFAALAAGAADRLAD